jgi:hypothetical protein
MSLNLVSEESLRSALRPFRVDPASFEAGVRARLHAGASPRDRDPLAGMSPLLRSAAAILPLPLLAGHDVAKAGAKVAPAAGISKLLGYMAFPAISLFMLLGATVFSVAKVRTIQGENRSAPGDEMATQKAIAEWWRHHKWGAWLVHAAAMVLFWIGATWPVFLFYIVSFGFLIYVLSAFAKTGLGNRQVLGSTILAGLGLLGQLAMFPMVGYREIHFVDQSLVAVVFWIGALLLLPIMGGLSRSGTGSKGSSTKLKRILGLTVFIPLTLGLIGWLMSPFLWPATPSRIKRHVESFDEAPYATASWRDWEIVASWALESKLDPDLAGARRLLAEEIAGEQDSFILGSAFRLGLVRTDQLGQLKDYESSRHFLVDQSGHSTKVWRITSLLQYDWVIRAALLRNDLSPADRDYLAKRLHATLDDGSVSEYYQLVDELRATQLLKAIGRPIDVARNRARVHDKLRKFHSTSTGGFQIAGGFKSYVDSWTGSLTETSYAVELMEFYGVPDGLDLNWVRSFLRPTYLRKANGEEWVAAVTLDRLNRLPGATRPTWVQVAYYERSFIAAVVLVALCLYAVLSSPRPKAATPVDTGSAF